LLALGVVVKRSLIFLERVTGNNNYASLFSLDRDSIIGLVEVLVESFLNRATTTKDSLVSRVTSGFYYNKLGAMLPGVVTTTSS